MWNPRPSVAPHRPPWLAATLFSLLVASPGIARQQAALKTKPTAVEATQHKHRATAAAGGRRASKQRATRSQATGSSASAMKTSGPVPEDIKNLGPLSIGHPHAGYLLNAVAMPDGPAWRVTVPQHRFGTQETVDALEHCATQVQEQFPGSEPVRLGSLSAIRGGAVPPHKSHRTGRDADVYFFRKPGARWLDAATREDIDLPRTWALLRCFITDTDTEMILIDQVPKRWLHEYALSVGESPEWLVDVFDDQNGYKSALVRHVPGHVAHMHVRFVSPRARKLAVANYDRLVQLHLVTPPVRAVTHVVKKGDTLSELAEQYKLKTKQIQALNHLKSTMIRIGQKLVLQESQDIRGARAAVWVPPRRRPPEQALQTQPEHKATGKHVSTLWPTGVER